MNETIALGDVVRIKPSSDHTQTGMAKVMEVTTCGSGRQVLGLALIESITDEPDMPAWDDIIWMRSDQVECPLVNPKDKTKTVWVLSTREPTVSNYVTCVLAHQPSETDIQDLVGDNFYLLEIPS